MAEPHQAVNRDEVERGGSGIVGGQKESPMAAKPEIVSIPHLDLPRYLGRWYEICRLPLKYEDANATDITATYTLAENGKVRVDNRCFDSEGKPTQALGEATAVDAAKSRLEVTFLPKAIRWMPFGRGDYWVLKLDPDYRMALVGTPDRKYLWVLAREPDPPPEAVQDFLDEAARQQFDLTPLIRPRHTGREVTDDMLAGQG
jgi:apolipoprotein D and lipocalin family protein